MKVYGDLGKTAKKLLNDDFVSDSKVKIQTKSDSGTSYTIEQVQSSKTGALVGDLAVKGKLFDQVVNTKFNTSGKVSTEITLDKLGVDGLKLVLNGASTAGGSANSASSKIEFSHKHVAAVALVDLLPSAVVTGSIATGHAGFTIGAESTFNVAESALTKYDFAASYADSAKSEITLALLKKAKLFKVSYSHAVSDDLSIGGEGLYDISSEAKTLTMGILYKLDKQSTFKTKLNTDGALSTSYKQQVQPHVSVTLCSALNVKELDKGQKLGLAIAYEP
mmetsp:Transcript_5096/g.10781  ORF Transcript_5096/g.10781 Transcript_5096/m.10781 type:complete len:278 (+) Transcript_5096:73-906(+)